MAVSKLKTDSTTRSKIGQQALEDLRVNLWAIDCQTCGRRFGRLNTPALAVDSDGEIGIASIHHRRCRAPGWRDLYEPVLSGGTRSPHLTWRAGTFLLTPGSVPMCLINPSYEKVVMRNDVDGWRISNLDLFVGAGLSLEMAPERATPVPGLSAAIADDRISLSLTTGGYPVFSCSVPLAAETYSAVRSLGWIMVGITSLLDVYRGVSDEQVLFLMGSGRIALGSAAITAFSGGVQTLDPGEFDQDRRARVFAVVADVIRRRLGVELDRDHLVAAFALCDANNEPIRSLADRDKNFALLLVARLYALESQEIPGDAVYRDGVHLMTLDAASADECIRLFTPVCDVLNVTIARLGARPTRQEPCLTDIVIGATDEFTAAYSFQRDRQQSWGVSVNCAQLAIIAGDEDLLSADFIRRYPRVAVF